jgi:YD repeat-containing protein
MVAAGWGWNGQVSVSDGQCTGINWKETLMDARGRASQVQHNIGPSLGYQYDDLDRLTQANYGGAISTLTYDYAGRKTQMADADMGAWYYAYNAAGELTRQRDARNQRTCLYYDALGRSLGKHYRSDDNCPSDPTLHVSYTYDQYSGVYLGGTGQRTGMSDASGNTTWQYDPWGRLREEVRTVSHPGGNLTFRTKWGGYNLLDQPGWMQLPSNESGSVGEMIAYTYDKQGALLTMEGADAYLSGSQYDAAGRLRVYNAGGSVASPALRIELEYFAWETINGRGLLSRIQAGTPGDHARYQDLRYRENESTPYYDVRGNLERIDDWKTADPRQIQAFTYDELNRLLSARAYNGAVGTYGPETYTYDDATGNLASKAGALYTYYDAHKHAVQRVTGSGGSSKTIQIRARSTPCNDGVRATMELWVNGTKRHTWTNVASNWTTYTSNPPLTGKDVVEVVFTNDCNAGGYDRNLFVDYVVVDGQTVQAEGGAAVIDKGSGSQAFDGKNVVAGQEAIFWNGALRFVVGAGAFAAGYDENGNMTSRVLPGAAYLLSYDAENRLVEVWQGSELLAGYLYDGDGRLVKRHEADGTTIYAGPQLEVFEPDPRPQPAETPDHQTLSFSGTVTGEGAAGAHGVPFVELKLRRRAVHLAGSLSAST